MDKDTTKLYNAIWTVWESTDMSWTDIINYVKEGFESDLLNELGDIAREKERRDWC